MVIQNFVHGRKKNNFPMQVERTLGDKNVVLCAPLNCVKKMWLHWNVVTHFFILFFLWRDAKWCQDTYFSASAPGEYHLPSCVIKLWLHAKFVKILWLSYKNLCIRFLYHITVLIFLSVHWNQQIWLLTTSELCIC